MTAGPDPRRWQALTLVCVGGVSASPTAKAGLGSATGADKAGAGLAVSARTLSNAAMLRSMAGPQGGNGGGRSQDLARPGGSRVPEGPRRAISQPT